MFDSKAKFVASVTLCAMTPNMAIAQNSGWGSGRDAGTSNTQSNQATLINALAEPDGGQKGSVIEMRVPAGAHLSEIIIYYDESPDRINAVQLYYQPDLNSDPVSTNFVGEFKGKSFRIPVGWNDIVTGITTQTDANGNLVAFKLVTNNGDRGYGSSESQAEQTRKYGDGLLFAGLTARASKNRVYALGIRTVPATAAPERASYNAKSIARAKASPPAPKVAAQPEAKTVAQATPPQKSGLAKALEDFQRAVEQGKRDRAFEAEQDRLRAEQQARNKERAQQQAAQAAAAARQREIERQRSIAAAKQPTPTKTAPLAPAITNKSGTTMDASLLRLGANSHAIIYSQCGYRGRAIGLSGGTWSASRLKQLGFDGQSINSVKLMPNKQITLNTQARKIPVTGNRSCLQFPVHARPQFTGFTVGTRAAVAAGQTKPVGFKPRKADQLQWTSVGVNGNNVGSVWYDHSVPETGFTQHGRFEMAEEGSNIWYWYIHSSTKDSLGNTLGRGSYDQPTETYRVLKRTATSITLRQIKKTNGNYVDVRQGNNAPWRDDIIDLKTGIIKSYGLFGDKPGYLVRGKIKTKSRPQ